jgi:serine/threonine-protein kinase
MRDDLLRASAGRPVRATPILSAADTTLLTPAASTAVLGTLPPDRRSRRAWAYAILALATIVVFVASLILVRSLFEETGAPVRVPRVTDMTEAEATQVLEQAGLEVGDVTEVFSDKPVGTVVDQDPLPGFSIASGGSVNLDVSKGIETVQVPDVTNRSLDDARAELEARGLKVGKVTEREQVGPPGRVLETTPKAGATVEKGAAVNLVVISGEITVPDVFGKTFEEARRQLEEVGFSNIVRQDVPAESPDEVGTVVGQDPARGTKADRDTRITLQVTEPAPTTPPPTTEPPVETTPPADPSASSSTGGEVPAVKPD